MTTAQRKAIFGRGRELGVNDEELHFIVQGVTGKCSLKELNEKETGEVIRELDRLIGLGSGSLEEKKPNAYKKAVPGMMTAEQQSKAWALMYKLMRLDDKPRVHENGKPYTVGERMAGAIFKLTGVTAKEGKNIFDWVSFENGEKLIEGLKRYVKSAEKKQREKDKI